MRVLRHWRIKGAIQGVLSVVPGGSWVNDRLQVAAGELRDFETNVARKVADWSGIVSYLDASGRGNLEGREILEIGTGWYPTLPFCFVLAGAGRVHTVDLNRHVRERMSFRALRALRPHLERISERGGVALGTVKRTYERLASATTIDELLRAANIHYRAPQDAARLDWLPDECLDMVYSNSVLEHVEVSAIGPIMREARRLLKPDGAMVHAVACNDHYAHFDRRISFVNYLAYTERQWRRWNNAMHFQNRLRASDFVRLAEESGFRVVREAHATRPGTVEALAAMKVAPEFRHYDFQDLTATTVDFVAVKASGTGSESLIERRP